MENDTSTDIMIGNLNDINSVSSLEQKLNIDYNSKKKIKKVSIFGEKKSYHIFTIEFFILTFFTLASIIAYIIVDLSINKVAVKIDDSNIDHTYMDKRMYEVIELKNGVEVALIVDKNSSISAIGVTLGTGVADDLGKKGMSHLLSKTFYYNLTSRRTSLFSNSLVNYLGKFHSSYNDNFTFFSYEVEKEGFTNCLKLFSSFLKKNFEKRDTGPSSLAIRDIERNFRLNINNRTLIERQILHAILFNDETGYFPEGNKETLASTDINSDLLSFFDSALFGKNIKIALFSNERMIHLKGKAIKYFSDIPIEKRTNRVEKKNEIKIEPGKAVIVILDDSNYQYASVSFYFNTKEINNVDVYLKYFKYLFSDKSDNSIFGYMYDFGITHDLKISISYIDSMNVEFKLQFETITQLLNVDDIDGILLSIYTLVQKFKETSNEELYKEYLSICNNNFKYQSYPSDIAGYVRDVSFALFNFTNRNIKEFTHGEHYLPPYSKEAIDLILSKFTYKNSILVIGQNSVKDMESILQHYGQDTIHSKQEYYYKTVYFYSTFNDELMTTIETSTSLLDALQMRKSNPYITKIVNPINGHFISSDISPNALVNTKHLKLYHKLDVSFDNPKVCAFIHLINLWARPKTETIDSYLNLYHYYLLKYNIERQLNDAIDAGNKIEVKYTE